MLLTNQKTINYENLFHLEGTTLPNASAKVLCNLNYFYKNFDFNTF